MNENKNLHHFLNMSRSIHENVIATKVNGTEITKNIGHIESKYAEINNDAMKRTGNSHQNLLKKFFMILFVFLIVKTFLKPDYCKLFKYLTLFNNAEGILYALYLQGTFLAIICENFVIFAKIFKNQE